jgi:hypothetical protein
MRHDDGKTHNTDAGSGTISIEVHKQPPPNDPTSVVPEPDLILAIGPQQIQIVVGQDSHDANQGGVAEFHLDQSYILDRLRRGPATWTVLRRWLDVFESDTRPSETRCQLDDLAARGLIEERDDSHYCLTGAGLAWVQDND